MNTQTTVLPDGLNVRIETVTNMPRVPKAVFTATNVLLSGVCAAILLRVDDGVVGALPDRVVLSCVFVLVPWLLWFWTVLGNESITASKKALLHTRGFGIVKLRTKLHSVQKGVLMLLFEEEYSGGGGQIHGWVVWMTPGAGPDQPHILFRTGLPVTEDAFRRIEAAVARLSLTPPISA